MSEQVKSWTYSRTPPPGLRALLRSDEILERVKDLAAEIQRDYGGRRPLVVAALKGAFVFLADLIRFIEIPLEVDFVRLASYGSGRKPTGEVRLVYDLATPVDGRDVLVVEDIVDTGLSLEFLVRLLNDRGARSVRVCALLDKPYRRKTDVRVDYVGFVIPDVFVVGYGIDFAEQHRQWPDIYALEEEEEGE